MCNRGTAALAVVRIALDGSDTHLTRAVVIRVVRQAVFLEGLHTSLVELVDPLGKLHRKSSLDAVMLVVEGVVSFLFDECFDHGFVRPVARISDRVLPSIKILLLSSDIAHGVYRCSATDHLAHAI